MPKENQAGKNARIDLSKAGRKRLLDETSKWERLNAAIASIMKPAGEES